MTLRMSPENAELHRDMVARIGAIVVGRHLYDTTQGLGGAHPMGCPVVVLTHRPPAETPSDQFFPDLADDAPLLLDGAEVTVGTGVTHVRYRVRQS